MALRPYILWRRFLRVWELMTAGESLSSAAHRAGLKTVVLPEKNLKDLIDLPKTAKSELKIIPVKHMDEVLQIALASRAVMEPPRPRRQPKEDGQDDGE